MKKALKKATGWDWDEMRRFYRSGYKIEMMPDAGLVILDYPEDTILYPSLDGDVPLSLIPLDCNGLLVNLFTVMPSFIPIFP